LKTSKKQGLAFFLDVTDKKRLFLVLRSSISQ